MFVAYVSAMLLANATSALSSLSAVAAAGVRESWLTVPIDSLATAAPAGLLIRPLGMPFFGIVPAIILIMFFVSALSTPARSRGRSPRRGLVIGLLVLVILTLTLNAAAP